MHQVGDQTKVKYTFVIGNVSFQRAPDLLGFLSLSAVYLLKLRYLVDTARGMDIPEGPAVISRPNREPLTCRRYIFPRYNALPQYSVNPPRE